MADSAGAALSGPPRASARKRVALIGCRLVCGLLAAAWLTAGIVADAAGRAVPAAAGALSGTVRLDGPLPKPVELAIRKDQDVCAKRPHLAQSLVVGSNGGVANAVVAIVESSPGERLKPKDNLKMDQTECQYVPHVLAFTPGSTVAVINSDGILHDIHTYPTNNPAVNFAQPGFKKVIRITVKNPDVIRVTCDAHGWMEGWWYVAATPYFAVTDASGHFEIKDLHPGEYTVKLWQEKLAPAGRERSQRVSIRPDAVTEIEFKLKPETSD